MSELKSRRKHNFDAREEWLIATHPVVRELSAEELESLPPGFSLVEAERCEEWVFRSRISKMCRRCHQVKLLNRFHRFSTMKDGRRPECKECRREQRAQAPPFADAW